MFMQALGRVRFKGTPKFTLYIKTISQKRLNGLVHRNSALLSLAAEIKQSKHYNRYVDRFRLEGDRTKGALLYLDYSGSYKFNDLLYHKLLRQKQYYEELAEAFDQYGDSAFPCVVHGWLGQPDAYDERNWLRYSSNEENKKELMEFLRGHNGRVLKDKSEQKVFSEKIHEIYHKVTGHKKRTDRGDGFLKMSGVNNCLEGLGIKGMVKSNGRGGGWIFSMAEDKK